MKLWLISQTETTGYDVYDSAVVAAESADEAQRLHPGEYENWWRLSVMGHEARERQGRADW